jgi:hypothetical protein
MVHLPSTFFHFRSFRLPLFTYFSTPVLSTEISTFYTFCLTLVNLRGEHEEITGASSIITKAEYTLGQSSTSVSLASRMQPYGTGLFRRRWTTDVPGTSQTETLEPDLPLRRTRTEVTYSVTKDNLIRVAISAYGLRWEKVRDYLRELFKEPGCWIPDELVS